MWVICASGPGLALCSCVLRITIQKTSNVVLLKLEGSVKGPWVEELQKVWLTSANMSGGVPVSVDLGGVTFVDARGRDLLLQMRKDGVALNGGSSFLRQVLEDKNTNSERSRKGRNSK